jgi:hypothetical protein
MSTNKNKVHKIFHSTHLTYIIKSFTPQVSEMNNTSKMEKYLFLNSMCTGPCSVVINEEELTRFYLVFYYTCDRLNMFQAPLCPSSGRHDYTVVYHLGRLVLSLLMVGG